MNHLSASESRLFRPFWRRSGAWMVIMLFTYASLMVGAMYLYWELHTRPFRPLQVAIHAQHPNSMPRVIGGRHKSHREGARSTLRIVVTVDFDPLPVPVPAGEATQVDSPQAKPEPTLEAPAASGNPDNSVAYTEGMPVDQRVHEWFRSLLSLAKQHVDLSEYEIIEIFLEQRRPEQTSRTLSSRRTKAEWFSAYPMAEPTTVPATSGATEPSTGRAP